MKIWQGALRNGKELGRWYRKSRMVICVQKNGKHSMPPVEKEEQDERNQGMIRMRTTYVWKEEDDNVVSDLKHLGATFIPALKQVWRYYQEPLKTHEDYANAILQQKEFRMTVFAMVMCCPPVIGYVSLFFFSFVAPFGLPNIMRSSRLKQRHLYHAVLSNRSWYGKQMAKMVQDENIHHRPIMDNYIPILDFFKSGPSPQTFNAYISENRKYIEKSKQQQLTNTIFLYHYAANYLRHTYYNQEERMTELMRLWRLDDACLRNTQAIDTMDMDQILEVLSLRGLTMEKWPDNITVMRQFVREYLAYTKELTDEAYLFLPVFVHYHATEFMQLSEYHPPLSLANNPPPQHPPTSNPPAFHAHQQTTNSTTNNRDLL